MPQAKVFFRTFQPTLTFIYGDNNEKRIKVENYNLVTEDPEVITIVRQQLVSRGFAQELSEMEFKVLNSLPS